MAPTRRLLALGVGAALLPGLVGCGGNDRGVSIPLGYESLDQCQPRSLAVENLRELGEPECNLAGSSLVFPDGYSLPTSNVGDVFSSTSSPGEHTYLIVNWGVPGVGAFTVHGDELLGLWATCDEAERLQREQARVEGVELD
ncbi:MULTISPECIES: hypothetical protein [Microbacterium]|uniref:hypothetical protein n=1 Tax=Microbacterium TaxID=33882 RepID=UPI00146B93CD|nr:MULTISPECIES: hypothetical protein [Microbacterium]